MDTEENQQAQAWMEAIAREEQDLPPLVKVCRDLGSGQIDEEQANARIEEIKSNGLDEPG